MQKIKSKDLDEEELLKRHPEIQEINNKHIQRQVINVFLDHCPEYYWVKPASSTGKYHPVTHRGEYGLWLHTQRAFTQFQRLARTGIEMRDINHKEADYGRAAILLHDMFKYADPEEGREHTHKEHDRIAAEYFENNTGLNETIIDCVRTHNGGWGCDTDPESELERLHHYADMTASDPSNPSIAVLDPHPVLREEFGDRDDFNIRSMG